MGLCKCPKKKVTNQFCFEHRVNVCEHCMVTNHSKCVVQSYLQWLQDSDYNPNCHICKTELADGDCIRLSCYHVFHWDCVNKYALSVPSHTPPEGYVCPICSGCIFPQQNAASPVAEALRNALMSVNWGRIGLGFPAFIQQSSTKLNLIESDLLSNCSHMNNIQFAPMRTAVTQSTVSKPAPITIDSSHSETNNMRPEPYGASFTTSYTSPRKMYDSTDHGHYKPLIADHDEDKYKRRSALEWFGRWFRSKTSHSRSHRKDPNVLYKKWVVALLIFLIGLVTLCVFLMWIGRSSADSDPLLDPRYNPNIRVEEVPDSNVIKADAFKVDHVAEKAKELLPA